MHVRALGVERIDAQVQTGALIQAFGQLPEFIAQLVFERLHQPLRQIVAVTFHQIRDIDFFALVKPVFFLVGQRAAQKIARTIKPQNRQSPLFGAAAGRCEMIKQQFFAQNSIDRAGQGGALARPQTPVIAEKLRHDGVGGMVEFEREPNQFGTDVE